MTISNPGKGQRIKRTRRYARQYQTHLQLLAHTSARLRVTLDAIVVPASRPAFNLDHAVTLARALRCHLVVLCSLKAQAAEVNNLLDLRNFTQGIVVDLPEGYTLPKLDLGTSRLASLELPHSCVNPNGDLSTKRNIGLLLARMVGWERIFFLDDDIRDLDASDLREVATMLGPYRAVGMRAVDFPDNSVVCHGHRKTGGDQDVFISGSVLAVHCTEDIAFFPEVYNEDWFFFYHAAEAQRLGRHTRDATQLRYDPFADPQRAAGQEFGDVMAEGLYGLLHDRIGADYATNDYWQSFLDSRMRFLEGVLARSETVEPLLRQRIVSSVEAAMTWTRQIEPSMCEHYVTCWRRDLGTWAQRLKDTPTLLSAKGAFRELGLVPSGPSLYSLAGIMGESAYVVSKGSATGQIPVRPGSGENRHLRGLVRRAIVLEERAEPPDVSRDRDNRPLTVGRHRVSPELPVAGLSSITEYIYSQLRAFLAELGPQLLLLYRRVRQNGLFLRQQQCTLVRILVFY